ncbi:MAG: hypothetical protein CL680_21425 [Blastomonas sp.]|nr:hypothetical protein [Blastomonas sp.]|tara:strand:- start:13394 stop:14359 length:966 start_codon:yes stop_codon:yes gene_type:complete
MLNVVRLLLFSLLLLLAVWSFIGIFNDGSLIFKYLNFLGQLVPYFSLAIAAALFWLLKTTKLKWGVIIIALPSIIIPLLVPNLNLYRGGNELVQQSGPIKSFSFVTFSKMSLNKDYKEIAHIINCNNYDIIQVQELGDVDLFLEAEPTIKQHCNVVVSSSNPQLVTFSKFPMIELKNKHSYYISVQVEDSFIALVNVHLAKSIKSSADHQIRSVNRLIKFANDINMPTIIAGDFNATPFNESISLMRANFRSVNFKQHMTDRSSTWPGSARKFGLFGPWLQIDHVFYRKLKYQNHLIHSESYGSDHYPIELSFSLQNFREE